MPTTMRTPFALLAAVAATFALDTAAAADFEAGQIWSAKARQKDPDPKVLVLRVDTGSKAGDVVFIAVAGVQICLPTGQCGAAFSPLAMSKRALDASVIEQVGRTDKLPDFEKGYQSWKEGVAKGAPVTITVPLAEALDQLEGGAKIQVK
jgi:hypothetical protein